MRLLTSWQKDACYTRLQGLKPLVVALSASRSGLLGNGCAEGTTRKRCKLGYQELNAQRVPRDRLRSGLSGTECAEGTTR
jgi:hypothetical protein